MKKRFVCPNSTLDALVAKTADNLRFHHAKSRREKVRTHTSFTYQAGSWARPRKVVARLECSLQPDAGETTSNGMRQGVDVRYVVASLKGPAEHLYEDLCCGRAQMEKLIKLHKAQLPSDRMCPHGPHRAARTAPGNRDRGAVPFFARQIAIELDRPDRTLGRLFEHGRPDKPAKSLSSIKRS